MTEDFCELIGLKVHYVKQGKGKPFLILAGWGTTIATYQSVIDDFSDDHEVFCIEMPGCGSTQEPDKALTSSDYVALVEEFIKQQKLTDITIFGHSNGGRTTIKMLGANKKLNFKVDKLILTGCAGLVQKKTAIQNLKTKVFKTGKKVLNLKPLKKYTAGLEEKIKQRSGSDDYRSASPVMRQTLVNLVNEDLSDYLPNIKQPTLLLWGELDDATPIEDGKFMESKIPDAALINFQNSTHYAFLENRQRFKVIIKKFLEEEE